jgi:hypothetical protein
MCMHTQQELCMTTTVDRRPQLRSLQQGRLTVLGLEGKLLPGSCTHEAGAVHVLLQETDNCQPDSAKPHDCFKTTGRYSCW